MDLTFNIIFVPGTVRYLRLAVLSLLKFSSYRYRLISNGLAAEESALLKSFCGSSDRLEFQAYPTKTTLAHGTLLSLLERRERGDFFCFMDSDIFASAPFAAELESLVSACDIFSSCSHLGLDPDALIGLDGRCLEAPNGMALATTFFCVYRREAIGRVIARAGVGFERYTSREHFPDQVAEELRRVGLPLDAEYDTGKLLSVLAQSHGLRLRYEPLAGLTHIGGIGKYIMKHSRAAAWKQRVGRWLGRPYVLSDEKLEPKAPAPLKAILSGRASGADTHSESWRAARRAKLLRRHVAFFFTAYFRALFDNAPEPVLAIRDSVLTLRITTLCNVIRQMFQEHDWKLAA